jgi:hypothetical protein
MKITERDVLEKLKEVNRLLRNAKLSAERLRGLGTIIYVLSPSGKATVWGGLTRREAWNVLECMRIVLEHESQSQ